MKQRIKLTEGDLHKIIKRSVNRIISELNRSTMQSAYDKMIVYLKSCLNAVKQTIFVGEGKNDKN